METLVCLFFGYSLTFSVHRDFLAFTTTNPATSEELETVKRNIEDDSASPLDYPDNSFAHFVPCAPGLAPELWKAIENPSEEVIVDPWKQLYRDCAGSVNLSGTWRSIYGGHGEEFIKVEHEGYRMTGTKLKGDINVPATKRTFEMTMLKNSFGRIWIGRIHLADTGYRNPRWGFATITVLNSGKFELYWYLADDYYVSNVYLWSENQNIPMGRPETDIFALFGMP